MNNYIVSDRLYFLPALFVAFWNMLLTEIPGVIFRLLCGLLFRWRRSFFKTSNSTSSSSASINEISTNLANCVISVIIPSYNEEKNIGSTIRSLFSSADSPELLEIIVSDASSIDNTQDIVSNMINVYGADRLRLVISAKPGRAAACNIGAKEAANGKILHFVHADTILPEHFDTLVRRELGNESTILGAFSFKVDPKTLPDGCIAEEGLSGVEASTRFRNKYFHLPFGDQTLFLRKSVFEKHGGFPSFKIMEDYYFVRLLRSVAASNGKSIVILNEEALCNGRRWIKHGIYKNTFTNQCFIFAFNVFKLSPDTIYDLYYFSSKKTK